MKSPVLHLCRVLAILAIPLALLGSARTASAANVALGEVTPPTAGASGVDRASLRTAAAGELGRIDTARVPRAIVVSFAVITSPEAGVGYVVNATVLDQKTGTMLAIIEGRARSEQNASPELRRAVARAALRTAVERIPDALRK